MIVFKISGATITDEDIAELRKIDDPLVVPSISTLCDLALGVAGVEVDAYGERLVDEDGEPREAAEEDIEEACDRCAQLLNKRRERGIFP